MQSLWSKFNALKPRERWLVFAAGLVVLAALLNALLVEPFALRQKALKANLLTNQTQMTQTQTQIAALQTQQKNNPTTLAQQKLADLKQKITASYQAIEELQSTLIKPTKVPLLLESIIKRNGNLKLVALKTLAATRMTDTTTPSATPADAKQEADAIVLYQHGVEVKVSGSYLDLLAYLEAVEQLPWHFLWGKLSLEAGEAGQSTMTFVIDTVSLDEAWLSI